MNHAKDPDRRARSVEDVLITEELTRRPSRAPDHALENRALTMLAEEMTKDPERVLQKVVETAIQLCRAGSAGISVLEPGEDDKDIFRWQAVAGPFAPNLYGTIPREASPCGAVIAHNEVLLFHHPERFFPAFLEIEPRIYEALLAPWIVNGEPIGTVWAIKHTPEGQFDAEDARLLSSLARFASAAWQMVRALQSAKAGQQDLEQRVGDRTRELRRSEEQYRTLFTTMEQGFCIIDKLPTPAGEPSDFRYVVTNPAFERHTGLRNPVGKTIRELVPKAETSIMDHYDRVVQTGQPDRFEGYVAELDLWIEAEVFPTPAPGHIAVLFSNVSGRKRAESALRKSEERFRTLFHSIDEAFCILEVLYEAGRPVDYRVLEVNPAFERHTGLTPAVGRTARELAPRRSV